MLVLSTETLVFVYLFGCAGSLSLRGLSLVVARGGSSLVAVHKLLTAVPSLVAERWLTLGTRASLAGAPALWSAGSVVVVWAYLLCGRWDLPRSGIEPVSPEFWQAILYHRATREALCAEF